MGELHPDLLRAVRACMVPGASVLAGRPMPDLCSLVACCLEYGLEPERLEGLDWLAVLLRCQAFLRDELAEAELPRGPATPADRELQPGERVSYTYDFLVSLGSYPGGECDRAGWVLEVLRDYLPSKDAVRVAWDDGIESVIALAVVARLGSQRTNADSATWHRRRSGLACGS